MKGRRYLGERRSMPLSSWPEQDRLAWEEALRPGDLFDQPSIAADWSPARRRIVVQAYGYWLMWLPQRDILDPNRHAGDRVSTILIAEFVNDLNQRVAPASVGMLVGGVKRMLEAIAPDHDWQWMRPLYRNLKRAAVPTRQKHTRVVEAAALFELGVRLFQEAEATPSDRRSYLIVARNGLIISLLAARPIRLGNLVSIEIGRHLVRSGGLYRLVFSAQETKVGRPIDLHCPAELTPYIDKYLEVYRPLLLARAKQRPPRADCGSTRTAACSTSPPSTIRSRLRPNEHSGTPSTPICSGIARLPRSRSTIRSTSVSLHRSWAIRACRLPTSITIRRRC